MTENPETLKEMLEKKGYFLFSDRFYEAVKTWIEKVRDKERLDLAKKKQNILSTIERASVEGPYNKLIENIGVDFK